VYARVKWLSAAYQSTCPRSLDHLLVQAASTTSAALGKRISPTMHRAFTVHDCVCTQHRTCLRSTQLDTAVTCLDYSPDGSQLVAGLGGITPKAGGFVVLRYSDFSVLVRTCTTIVTTITVNLHALKRC
jgi:hypothetical protein